MDIIINICRQTDRSITTLLGVTIISTSPNKKTLRSPHDLLSFCMRNLRWFKVELTGCLPGCDIAQDVSFLYHSFWTPPKLKMLYVPEHHCHTPNSQRFTWKIPSCLCHAFPSMHTYMAHEHVSLLKTPTSIPACGSYLLSFGSTPRMYL